ncbi:hypothetical protein [Kitasatospora paranensis]|uniref:Uncharacterized protein n=1 Tax=Kitasatospora paranensis TaxID=258053 RepID=A0ABW2FQS5_9ACTN
MSDNPPAPGPDLAVQGDRKLVHLPASTPFDFERSLAFLATDKEMLRAAARVYGRAVGEDEFVGLAGRYGDLKGYWGHYLRVSG